ncbi:hypothetical protein D030_2679A, partial [Vibrio parahaemolyticus AQ3810]
MVAHTCCS